MKIEQGKEIKLFIPATWKSQNAFIYIETDEHLTDRPLSRCEWVKSPADWSSKSDYYVCFAPRRNGSYRFEVKNESKSFKSGFLNVQAKLSDASPVSKLGSIIVQTLVPKSMGQLDNWDDIIKHATDCNYNMIHFTPLQSLGMGLYS